jgi:hypothetical protein
LFETRWLEESPLKMVGHEVVELLHRHRTALAAGLPCRALIERV